MASLLDKVLDSKDNPSVDDALFPTEDVAHKLPDGSTVNDSTIAAINRIFKVNPHLYKRLLASGWTLFNGDRKIDLSSRLDLMSLIRADWEPKNDWQEAFMVEKIMELTPVYSWDCYIIGDGLIWDKKEAKLKRFTEEDNIRTAL